MEAKVKLSRSKNEYFKYRFSTRKESSDDVENLDGKYSSMTDSF